MAIPKQKFREIVLLFLYSCDFSGLAEEDSIPFIMKELEVSKKHVLEALDFFKSIQPHLEGIDARIAKHSTSYAFKRIPAVERNILRLGAYELLFSTDLPPKVALAESIRLTRKFATPEGATFVNAVLDAIYQDTVCNSESDPEEADACRALDREQTAQ